MGRKILQYLVIPLLILLGAGGIMMFLSAQKEEPKKETPPEIKKYVQTQPVKYSDITTEVVAFGRVRTAESLDLIAEVPGRMFQGNVLLKEGQKFNKGALLFRIDNTEAKLNIQAQKSNFLRDLAAILPDFKIDFSGNYPAWESYFRSIDIEKSLPKLPAHSSGQEKTFLATKNIYSTYYAIKSAEANLRKYHFYAPFAGNISIVNLQSGSFVNPGNNIGKILRSNKLELKVAVETKDISWITRGEPVKISSEDGLGQWTGIITRIGEFVNQNTQSIDVFIAIERNDFALYDGQYLKATMPAKQIKNGMIIPRNAIFNDSEVFVLNDTVLNVKQVNIHKLNPETAVFSGIEEGTDLVVEPLVGAHNNMKAFKLEEDKDFDLETKLSSTESDEN